VGIFHGGTLSNVVAAEAYAEVDVRFSSGDEAARIESEFHNLRPSDPRVQLTVTGGINRPPLERNDKVLALYEQARNVARRLEFELGETQVGGASDGNFAAAAGAPVLDGLGIDGDGAHASHEHILIDDIPRRGALLAGLIASLSVPPRQREFVRRGSGGEKVARRETSGQAIDLEVRAEGARESLSAPPVRSA